MRARVRVRVSVRLRARRTTIQQGMNTMMDMRKSTLEEQPRQNRQQARQNERLYELCKSLVKQEQGGNAAPARSVLVSAPVRVKDKGFLAQPGQLLGPSDAL